MVRSRFAPIPGLLLFLSLLLQGSLHASGCEDLRSRRDQLAGLLGLAEQVLQQRENLTQEIQVVESEQAQAMALLFEAQRSDREQGAEVFGQPGGDGGEGARRIASARERLQAQGLRRQELLRKLPGRDEVRAAQEVRSRHYWELQELEARIAACAPEGWSPTASCPYDQFGPYSWYRVEDIERAVRLMNENPSWTAEQAMGGTGAQPKPDCVR